MPSVSLDPEAQEEEAQEGSLTPRGQQPFDNKAVHSRPSFEDSNAAPAQWAVVGTAAKTNEKQDLPSKAANAF